MKSKNQQQHVTTTSSNEIDYNDDWSRGYSQGYSEGHLTGSNRNSEVASFLFGLLAGAALIGFLVVL